VCAQIAERIDRAETIGRPIIWRLKSDQSLAKAVASRKISQRIQRQSTGLTVRFVGISTGTKEGPAGRGRRGQVLGVRKGEGSPHASNPGRRARFPVSVTRNFDCALSATGFGSKAIRIAPKQKAPPRTGPDSSLEVFGSRRKPLPSACQTNSERADAFQSAFQAFPRLLLTDLVADPQEPEDGAAFDALLALFGALLRPVGDLVGASRVAYG
jgi:hypothetical protein